MDCCNGWTAENFHDDTCPAFNRAMDAMDAFETQLRNSPDWVEN